MIKIFNIDALIAFLNDLVNQYKINIRSNTPPRIETSEYHLKFEILVNNQFLLVS